MILLYLSDSGRNPCETLIHDGDQPDSLNDIVQEADSAKRDVRHGDTHIESRTHSRHVEKERIKN